MSNSLFVPWVLALATGVWFGFMARKAQRSLALWALTGTVFGLVTSTIVWGIGNAMALPFSESDNTTREIKCTLIAVIAVAALGWLFTGGLHRHLFALLNIKPALPQSSAAQTSAAAPQKQEFGKTPIKR